MARLPKKSLFGVLVLVILMLFTMRITDFSRSELSPVEIILRDTLAPLQGGVTGVSDRISTVMSSMTQYREMSLENQELQKQLGTMAAKLSKMEEYRQENLRLRKMLRLKDSLDSRFRTTAAVLIARDTSNWYHSIIVDQGKEQGISYNMPVINDQGLVGRVIAVTNNTAEVLLLMDPEGTVGGLIQDTRTPGIVRGSGKGEVLDMVHLAHDAPVQKNQVVVTSGLGDIFPKGLRVGYIVGAEIEANGLVKRAKIEPFVDFDRLEEVYIITDSQGDR